MGEKKSNGKANVSFNPERAIEVARRIFEAYDAGYRHFRESLNYRPPEHDAVDGIDDKLQASQLLFFVIGSDHLVNSRVHYKAFRSAYDRDASSIDIRVVANMSKKEAMDNFRQNFSIGLPQTAENLYKSARYIARFYDADPRKYVSQTDDIYEAIRLVTRLPGFGKQSTKLLLKNYTELDFVHYENEHLLPPKIDLHNVRISIGTGILSFKKEGRYHDYSLTGVLDKGFDELCKDGEIDGRRYNNLLWSIGQRLCSRRSRVVCKECPLYENPCKRLVEPREQGTGVYDTRTESREAIEPLF